MKDLLNVFRQLYGAPEALENNQFSEKSDVFGFGMVMYAALHKQVEAYQIFPDLKKYEISSAIIKGHRPIIDSNVNPELAKLITRFAIC